MNSDSNDTDRSGSEISPARRAAYDALTRPPFGDPADEDFFGPLPVFEKLGRNDRALAERIYRGVLQNLRLLDHLLARSGAFRPSKTKMKLRWLLRMAAYQKIFLSKVPDYAIVQQTVEQARLAESEKASRFMNGVLRTLMLELPDSGAELEQNLSSETGGPPAPELRYSLPGEIARAFGEAYGAENLEPLLRSANEEDTPVWLRVNRLKIDPEALRDSLAAEGVESEIWNPAAPVLLWKGGRRPWESKAWARGELTVQDLGAMLAVEILRPEPGERVIDWCAAPGGKTGQIWEAMHGRGELFAYEPNAQRRAVLSEALHRLYDEFEAFPKGLTVLGEVQSDPETGIHPPAATAVLVDAPCLGLGLIRRHPEVRWDNRLQQRTRIARIQTFILDAAARHVAPGGRLLWVTCSPTRDEIEERIQTWLGHHAEFELADSDTLIPPWARPWTHAAGPWLRTRPDLERVDGFGLVLLRRR